MPDPGHVAHEELARCYADVEDYFRQAATEAGLADPDELASQLGLLVPGAITVATVRKSADPARAARAVAARLSAAAATRTE
jgi:hypothetical protein